jgi:hypothetical protein
MRPRRAQAWAPHAWSGSATRTAVPPLPGDGVAALRDGTLTFQFSLIPTASTTTAAVTGGTGAYANARGVVVSKGTKAGADDTVTLVE